MSLTKLSLGGNNFKFFLHRQSLVRDIPAGDGNVANLFYSVALCGISSMPLLPLTEIKAMSLPVTQREERVREGREG